MDLKGILSVSGYGGLFKLIKQSKSGFIVESLLDNKRMQAFATSKISTLEEIAIYTESSEVHLKEVLRSIFRLEEGKPVKLGAKSTNDDFKAYFGKILPDYDKERVYVSDMKKVVTWYNLLLDKGLVDLEEDKEEEKEAEAVVEETNTEVKEQDVKKETKKTASKTTKKIAEKVEKPDAEKKTVKKAVKKDKKENE
jgi:cobalamin-dependent methionine synthase I